MTNLETLFTDFAGRTTSASLSSVDKVSNQVTKRGYILKRLLQGGPGHDLIQGGLNIRADMILDQSSTAVDWSLGDKFSFSDPQIMSNSQMPWRFTTDWRNWQGPTVVLQGGTSSGKGRRQLFMKELTKIDVRVANSLGTHMEGHMLALPDWATMEEADGNKPNSLLTFCNELPSGLYYSYRTANSGLGDNKVLGINKVNKPGWDNQRLPYTKKGAMQAGHFFTAFEKAVLSLGFEQMPGPDGGDKTEDMQPMPEWFTNMEGRLQYTEALTMNQDHFRGSGSPSDPHYRGPAYNGVKISYIEELDTAEVYPTAQALSGVLGAETTYGTWENTANTNAGPRYHLFDFDVTHKYFHKDKYFKRGAVRELENQVEAYVQPITCYHNNGCTELRRNAVIYPTATVTA